jgi:hypothetical protein
MVLFLSGFHTGDIFPFHLMNVINHRLEQNKSKLCIEAVTSASRVSGFTLITIRVANARDLKILKLYVGHTLFFFLKSTIYIVVHECSLLST